MFCTVVKCVTGKVKVEESRVLYSCEKVGLKEYRVLYSCEVCDWQGRPKGVSCAVQL